MKTWPGTLAPSDMLRSGFYVPVLVTFTFIGFVNAEFTVYNDGWMPISPDTLYKQVRRELAHTSNYHDIEHRDDTFRSLEQGSEKYHTKDVVYKEHLKDLHILGPAIFPQITKGTKQNVINNRETKRKAKEITEYVVTTEVNNSGKNEEEPVEKETINKILLTMESSSDDVPPRDEVKPNRNVIADDSTNIYEVTEDPKVEYITDQNDLNGNFDNYYNTPVIQNITSKFFDILSKYNIKANDKLQNYELSRLDKADISMNKNYRTPLSIPYGHNSPNHVPIDPLFAVFLSNYGVYLPGMYGINSNYNNRYGYLASNNIHNNKPFGLYKVYSDTDSSN